MKRNNIFIIIFFFIFSTFIFPQFSKNPDIENLLNNLPPLNEYENSHGIILKREIKIELNENGTIKKRVYSVIKIMDKKGAKKFSTLKILYNKNFEKIDFFQAGTYNETGIFTSSQSAKDEKSNYIKKFPLYDNYYFKVLNFENVQKGNVIEVGYDVLEHGKNLDGILILEDYEPILNEDITISIPENKDLFFKLVNGEKIFSESYLKDGYKIYHFQGKDLKPIKEEINSPPIDYFATRIIYSTYKSWKDTINLLRKKFLSENKEKIDLPDKIKKSKDKLEYLKNTFFYISNIKNVLVPLEKTFFKINSPNSIIKNGYGDNIDKAYLMYRILKMGGIDVYPVLFENHRVKIDKNIPTLKQFNYVGLKVILDKKVYYFNPMIENAAFPYSSFINKNVCLTVKEDSHSFEEMKLNGIKNGYESNFEININRNLTINFKNITSTWGGFSIVARGKLKNATEDNLVNSIKATFPDVKNISVKLSNLKKLIDPFKISLKLDLTNYLLKERSVYFLQLPPNIYDFTTIIIDTSLEKRENPLYVGEPLSAITNYIITFPKGISPLLVPDKLKFESKYLDIYIIPEYLKDKNILKIKKEIETKSRYIPKSLYEKVKEAIKKFNKPEYNLLMFKENK